MEKSRSLTKEELLDVVRMARRTIKKRIFDRKKRESIEQENKFLNIFLDMVEDMAVAIGEYSPRENVSREMLSLVLGTQVIAICGLQKIFGIEIETREELCIKKGNVKCYFCGEVEGITDEKIEQGEVVNEYVCPNCGPISISQKTADALFYGKGNLEEENKRRCGSTKPYYFQDKERRRND